MAGRGRLLGALVVGRARVEAVAVAAAALAVVGRVVVVEGYASCCCQLESIEARFCVILAA